MSHLLVRADARRTPLASGSVHCCITSPPFFGLRDYQTGRWAGGDPACDHKHPNARPDYSNGVALGTRGGRESSAGKATPMRGECGKCGAIRVDRQIGLEPTPADFVAALVGVGREVKRVLRDDGVWFLNLGDSFATGAGSARSPGGDCFGKANKAVDSGAFPRCQPNRMPLPGLKPKDLIGIPHVVAFALRDELSLYLRDAIVWSKAEVDESGALEGSTMPGSQRDRCTFAYEMVFLFAKSPRYYFDPLGARTQSGATLRNVWRVNPEPNRLRHYAAWPTKLVERMVRLGTSERGCCGACGAPWAREVAKERLRPAAPSGMREIGRWAERQESDVGGRTSTITLGWRPSCACPPRDPVPCVVLDPFSGSGTTGVVALALGRRYVGCDLSPDYLALSARRIARPHAPPGVAETERPGDDLPLFAPRERSPE